MNDVKTHCYTLIRGNCLERMKEIPDGSVDMVLTDPPYGTTACSWDSVIPFEPMWAQLKRITKKNGAIVMTASQPFTSALVMSNPKDFKYDWIWEKNTVTGFANAKKQPLRNYENAVVFGNGVGALPYFPQGLLPLNKVKKNGKSVGGTHCVLMFHKAAAKARCGLLVQNMFKNIPTIHAKLFR